MVKLPTLIYKNIDYYWKKSLVNLRELQCSFSTPELIQPIFIIGCSRAGTTLVYKTFSEAEELGSLQKETHDYWARFNPLSDKNWDTHAISSDLATESIKSEVSKLFYTQTGKSRVVDKNNQNGLSIPFLYNLFPDAHFVFIKRSPGDNINSLIHGWGKADEYGSWSDMLPDTINVEQGKYKRWCFFLADGWREHTDSTIEEVCAFQYSVMNKAILTAKKQIPEKQWHELFYERLIGDPIGEFESVIEACGVNFDDNLNNHCREVISKPYNAFSEIKIDKWKEGSNSEKIERVLPLVKHVALQLGY